MIAICQEIEAAIVGVVVGWMLSIATQWITGRHQAKRRARATRSRSLARLDKIALKLRQLETGQTVSTVTLGAGALNPTKVGDVLE